MNSLYLSINLIQSAEQRKVFSVAVFHSLHCNSNRSPLYPSTQFLKTTWQVL